MELSQINPFCPIMVWMSNLILGLLLIRCPSSMKEALQCGQFTVKETIFDILKILNLNKYTKN
jgi:hypothetical protein